MAYGIDRINAVQEVLLELVPGIGGDLVFDMHLGAMVLKVDLTDTTNSQYFFRKGYLWTQFNFVDTGPFTMPPSYDRSPYRERNDSLTMAIWIAASVGGYDALHIYSPERSSDEINGPDLSAFWTRMNALFTFLTAVEDGKIPSSRAHALLAGQLLKQYIFPPMAAWKAKNSAGT